MTSNALSDSTLQRGIQKVSGRKLSSFNWFVPYLILPTHPKTFVAAWYFVGTVIKDFLILQFFEKWRIYKIPIVNVQVPLDDNVPFTPSKVKIYLTFINFWLSPVTMLFHRFGLSTALPFAREFLNYIRQAYAEATKVYSYRLSTTNRPDYRENAQFKTIHRFDPHFLCVPSLHVAIVVLCFSFFKMLFDRENFTEEEKKNWNEELFKGAGAITESVLFVKQHSVNCVPAAIYMMTRITPLITKERALEFIDSLFTDTPEVTGQKRQEVVDHIRNMFLRFSKEGETAESWEKPIQNWLVEHAKTTNQTGAF